MSEESPRYRLPFIVPGQAQKELFHNEALVRIDMALQAAVEEGPIAGPPANPQAGQCWLVAAGATGDWTGRDGQLAMWTGSGWRFVAPTAGMTAWNKAAALLAAVPPARRLLSAYLATSLDQTSDRRCAEQRGADRRTASRGGAP